MEELRRHVAEDHSTQYERRESALNGAVSCRRKRFAEHRSLSDLAAGREFQELRDAVFALLTEHPRLRIALVANVIYELESVLQEEEEDPAAALEIFPLRSRYLDFHSLTPDRTTANLRELLAQIEQRDEDLLMSGSGWRFVGLRSVDILSIELPGIKV